MKKVFNWSPSIGGHKSENSTRLLKQPSLLKKLANRSKVNRLEGYSIRNYPIQDSKKTSDSSYAVCTTIKRSEL